MEKPYTIKNLYYFKNEAPTPISDKAGKYLTRCNMPVLQSLNLRKVMNTQHKLILEMRECSKKDSDDTIELFLIFDG